MIVVEVGLRVVVSSRVVKVCMVFLVGFYDLVCRC